MTTGITQFQAMPRTTLRKVKPMRRQGITPAHLYGKGVPSISLQADSQQLAKLVAQAGANNPVALTIAGTGESHFTFIREVQRHPVTEAILHVDFMQVSMTEKMQADVPIELVGEPEAVRIHGGMLFQALNSIQVECLPLDLPSSVAVDVSELDDFEKTVIVAAINLGDRVTILTDPQELIARVHSPRVSEEGGAEALAAEAPAGDEAAAEGTRPSEG